MKLYKSISICAFCCLLLLATLTSCTSKPESREGNSNIQNETKLTAEQILDKLHSEGLPIKLVTTFDNTAESDMKDSGVYSYADFIDERYPSELCRIYVFNTTEDCNSYRNLLELDNMEYDQINYEYNNTHEGVFLWKYYSFYVNNVLLIFNIIVESDSAQQYYEKLSDVLQLKNDELSNETLSTALEYVDNVDYYYDENVRQEIDTGRKRNPDINYEEYDDITYPAGMYKVGKNIPVGEYLFVVNEDEYSGKIILSSDSSGYDTIYEELFINNTYLILEENTYINFTGASAQLSFYHNMKQSDVHNIPEGTYIVGKDIPKGDYQLTCNDGPKKSSTDLEPFGYWNIYESSHYDKRLIDVGTFGQFGYVSVEDGEYLEIYNCTASLTD